MTVGDKVNRGDSIATVAEPTGDKFELKLGAHLHFEVHKNGDTVNPSEYLGIN